jgi:hypothetical protein
MLILDALKGHLTQEVKGEIRRANIDLTVVPVGMMSQLHVLDMVINKPFKDHLWQLYNDWFPKGKMPLF